MRPFEAQESTSLRTYAGYGNPGGIVEVPAASSDRRMICKCAREKPRTLPRMTALRSPRGLVSTRGMYGLPLYFAPQPITASYGYTCAPGNVFQNPLLNPAPICERPSYYFLQRAADLQFQLIGERKTGRNHNEAVWVPVDLIR